MVSYFTLIIFFIVAMLDMNISQFLKSLGLEHLRDIFEREQVSCVKKNLCEYLKLKHKRLLVAKRNKSTTFFWLM